MTKKKEKEKIKRRKIIEGQFVLTDYEFYIPCSLADDVPWSALTQEYTTISRNVTEKA